MNINIICEYCGEGVLPDDFEVIIEDRFGYGEMLSVISCNDCFDTYTMLLEGKL
jgi:hypothetical protein